MVLAVLTHDLQSRHLFRQSPMTHLGLIAIRQVPRQLFLTLCLPALPPHDIPPRPACILTVMAVMTPSLEPPRRNRLLLAPRNNISRPERARLVRSLSLSLAPFHDCKQVLPLASLMSRLDTLISLDTARPLHRPRDTLTHMTNAGSARLAEPRGIGASGARNLTEASAWGDIRRRGGSARGRRSRCMPI